MAIFDCKECGQRVSDKAASCPSCGAPVAVSTPPPRSRRVMIRTLLTLGVICLIAAAFWAGRSPDRLAGMMGHFDRGAVRSPAIAAVAHPVALVERDAMARGVYQTTAEQLYRDYGANPVAAEGKIDGRRIRITGRVAAIDEDAAGHPQVMLAAGADDNVNLLLNDDQKSVVAELVKGDSVDIQCDRIQRDQARPVIASPQGRGCGLVLVDVRSAEAYLAVFMSADKGSSPLYIVGPMSKDVCLARSDRISDEVTATSLKNEHHVVSKNCAATAHDSIPLDGCRLSSSMSAVPDLPTAHLWRYDCASPTAPTAPTRATRAVAVSHKPVVRVALTNDEPELPNAGADVVASLPTFAPPAAASAVPAIQAVPAVQELAPAAMPVVAAGGVALGQALSGPETDTAAASPKNVAGASNTDAVPAKSAAVVNDLSAVKAADPAAADHIASYCDTATAAAANHAEVAAGCRHAEAAAWTRLVVQNEFPTLDEATRRKCSQPPFPDSYVAKESCAKYQLHVN
jgi:hypothetical protein